MSLGRPLRALVLLVLLLGHLVPGPVEAQPNPPAAPQAQPTICFDQDRLIAPGQCRGDVKPNYLQSSSITIDIQSVTATDVSVRCVSGCPSGDPSATHVYYAPFRGAPLVFPRDFVDPHDGDGSNAVADKAPRYNSTWEVSADLPGAPSRQFDVWLYDGFRSQNKTLHPGEYHYLRAGGFPPGADVSMRWERRDPFSGNYVVINSKAGRAASSGTSAGWFEEYFRLPPSEATNISACGIATRDCYRVTISGTGKQTETANVQVGVARIQRSLDTTPRAGQTPGSDLDLQRSQNATFDIDLYYPGGIERHGPKLQVRDIPVHPTFGPGAIRAVVEKNYRNNASIFQLDEVPVIYDPQTFLWRAQWTIPKDLTPERNTAFYRIRIVEQADRYGNIIAEDLMGNFTVDTAQLQPTVANFFRELERTELGTLQLAVRYHNGTPFTPADAREGNQSPLRGCFLHLDPPPPAPAPPPPPPETCPPNGEFTWGRYDPTSGRWNFTVRYARDYANLDTHRFILENGTTDRYTNTIFALATSGYTVIPAKPDVEFLTVARGRDTDVFERGQEIFVSATITYHDGTPYNHNVRVDPKHDSALTINGRLLRRGPGPNGEGYGPLAGDEPFNLTETDPNAGRWTGKLQLSDRDTDTPVGIWTFQFDIADNVTVPNINKATFDREVVSSTIVLCPTFQPTARVPTGATIKFRFKLFYSECDTGREVAEASILSRLSARVHQWDPARQALAGPAVSNILVPSYDRASSFDWGIEYTVPDPLYAGSYVIQVSGADTFGNKLVSSARSRPFTTFTDIRERSVLAQPAGEVKRGESATVVFDARPGDTSTDPNRRAPRIQLERFDVGSMLCPTAVAERGCWVRERADVRVPDPSYEDHVGEFPVDIDTPVGLYRFSLQGRDSTFHLITGLSGNFTVNPTDVSRALLTPPPERIVKGEAMTFYIEQKPGDTIKDRVIFRDGRPIVMPNPQLVSEYGRLNVTWSVPFEAPTGNYTLRLTGRDVNGNTILILTPPIEALSASLEGRLLGQPTRAIERGTVARILFAIAYPDGGFYAAQDAPRVFVHNATGTVASAFIRREGLSFAAEWRPSKDAPLGDYYFEVSPQATGTTGNEYPPLRSNTFKLVPGRVVRPAVDQMGESVERLSGATYSVPFEPTDKFVAFDLVYYGPSVATAIDTTNPPTEVTRSPLPHTIDANGGKYVARLVTDQQSQTGTFRIAMRGEDGNGNRIVAESRPFIVRATTVGIQFDSFPPQKAFGESKTITISFVAKYAIGTLMDDTYGRPSVVALFNERPITQRPELEFLDGHWYMRWTAPDTLPDGNYQFAIGGFDTHGNPIAASRSTPYIVQTSVGESFAKSIPGPSPLVAIAIAAALATLLMRRREK